MPKLMRIDFYRLTMPDDKTTRFEQVLESVHALPAKSRTALFKNVPIRLQHLRQRDGYYIGDLARIRMEGIPPITRLSGEEEDIELPEDAGLGEEAAFLFYPAVRVLVLQRNRFSLSAAAFEDYFCQRGKVQRIDLTPVVKRDALQRFRRMTIHRRLDVTLAGAQNLEQFKGQDRAVSSLVDIAQTLRAPVVGLSVSMGHASGGLSGIFDAVRALKRIMGKRGEQGQDVTKIVVSGREGDGPLEVIDLLEERMVEEEMIDLGRKFESSRKTRQAALYDAFARRRDELVLILAPPK